MIRVGDTLRLPGGAVRRIDKIDADGVRFDDYSIRPLADVEYLIARGVWIHEPQIDPREPVCWGCLERNEYQTGRFWCWACRHAPGGPPSTQRTRRS